MKQLLNALFITLLVVTNTWAATPVGPMNYQGRLLDDAGIPVTGNYNFVVKIYDDPVAGVLKYQESHNALSVDDGVYSFKVGTGTNVTGSWDIDLWQGNLNDLFLELMVNGETLTPRHELTSAPHAFTATLALSAGALGNKTAAEFDNILQGVCIASKGKWLDNIQRCLGAGATITNENAATMASDLDYSNLDLTKADITGTQFANANFSNTIFKNTELTIGNFSGANLSGARLDGVISSGMSAISINLSNATLTNMSLSGWNLSAATVSGLSAANLTACPSTLPAQWFCAEMKSGSNTYFLFGPGANLSADSVAAISKHGFRLLNMDDNHFVNKNLSGASFEGIDLSGIDFSNANLSGANLDYTTILSGSFGNTNLNGTSFRFSQITSTLLNTATLDGNDFSNANIKNSSLPGGGSDMIFKKATLKNMSIGSMTDADFSYALLDYITFTGDMFGTLDFSHTNFWNAVDGHLIASATLLADNITAFGEGIVGGFNIPFPPGTVLNNPTFDNVTLQSSFDAVTFNNGTFHKAALMSGKHAYNAIFNNCQLSDTTLFTDMPPEPPSLHGSTFTGGSIAGLPTSTLSINSSAFVNGGLSVSFTNVAFSYAHFVGIWQLMPNPSCAGCTFTNTQWTTQRCPNSGLGSPAIEEPAGSGIYQCPGWY